MISAYALTFAGLLLLGGRAADLLGRRRMFVVGILFFTIASLLCGLAWSPAALIAARAIQGVGAAIMTPTALSIISTTFPEGSERNKALGIWSMMGATGATAAWLIGGPLVEGPGWEWIFFINIPARPDRARALARASAESRSALTRRSYDPAGALTITGALFLLVCGGRRGARRRLGLAADNPPVRRLGGASWRLRADRVTPPPLLPLRILRSHTLVGANLVMLLFGTIAFGTPFILTSTRSRCSATRPSSSGSAPPSSPIMAAIGSIVSQAVVLKVGFRTVAATGMALLAGGALILTQVSAGGGYVDDMLFGLLVYGAGIVLPSYRHGRRPRRRRRARVRARLRPQQHRLPDRRRARRRHRHDGCRHLPEDYLAANDGANPLVVLNEGFQSAFLACVVLAGIGLALALLLLARGKRRRSGSRPSRSPSRTTDKENQMGKIVVSDNVTLDGVIQDPAGDEGFRLGGWPA